MSRPAATNYPLLIVPFGTCETVGLQCVLMICRFVLIRPAGHDPSHCTFEDMLTVELQYMLLPATCFLTEGAVNIDWTHDK